MTSDPMYGTTATTSWGGNHQPFVLGGSGARVGYGNHQVQREALELKIWHPRDTNPLKDGLIQLDRYLDRLGLETPEPEI
jgi:hypothetical protein